MSLPAEGVFDPVLDDLDYLSWVDPGGGREQAFSSRCYWTEDAVRQLAEVWRRLRASRLRQVEWNARSRRFSREEAPASGLLDTTTNPAFAALTEEDALIDDALRVDFKSLFLFGDLALASFTLTAEAMWEGGSLSSLRETRPASGRFARRNCA